MKRTNDDERARIREVFLSKRDEYEATEAARLTGVDPERLADEIERGWVETRTAHFVDREDVLRLALEQWPLATIYAALGKDADQVLPRLLRLEELRLRVPAYIVRVVEFQAKKNNFTASETLRYVLREYAENVRGAHPEMDQEIPGLAEAMSFPGKPPTVKK